MLREWAPFLSNANPVIQRLLREVLVWSNLHHRNVAAFCGLDFSETNVEQLVALDALDSDPKRELRIPGLVSLYLRYSILEYVTRHPELREACVRLAVYRNHPSSSDLMMGL